MSADNFFLVTPHPTSGFAVLMGFASNEYEVLKASKRDKSYPTLEAAVSYATSEYSEYGVEVSPEATALEQTLAVALGSALLELDALRNLVQEDLRESGFQGTLESELYAWRRDDSSLDDQIPLDKQKPLVKMEIVNLINQYHKDKHSEMLPLQSAATQGFALSPHCTCRELKEMVVFSILDEATGSKHFGEYYSIIIEALNEIIVGLSERDAMDVVERGNREYRITELDGEHIPVTRDYKTNRINLKIKDGVVYEAYIE